MNVPKVGVLFLCKPFCDTLLRKDGAEWRDLSLQQSLLAIL